jgi:uncharacterized protein with beta-barrel porin domain
MPARAAWRRALLTTTSIVSIAGGALIGEAPSPALAACATNITGNAAGCTNSTTITGINIHNANVSSSINNTGTISPNGITVQTNSTITGGIDDTGTIAGGIRVDNTSTISAAGAPAININATFTGGVSNAGTLISNGNSAALQIANSYFNFSGGVTNTGKVFGAASAVDIANLRTFTGGVTNTGTISASGAFSVGLSVFGIDNSFGGGITNGGTIGGHLVGLLVSEISTSTGNITNTGTISSTGTPSSGEVVAALEVGGINTFQGNIVNGGGGTGLLSSDQYGIVISGITSLGGSVTNNTTITAQSGIYVDDVATFSGNISNGGQITATHTGIAIVSSTIEGSIVDRGNILATDRGIFIDHASTLNSTKTAVLVQGSNLTFTGGISNAGTIEATARGVLIDSLSSFSGGITNSGMISAGAGIGVGNTSTFSGGISNGGTITSPAGSGIAISTISTFAGGIGNSGALLVGGQGIIANSISAFSGGISNGGNLSAGDSGIQLSSITTFGGNVSNSGTITAGVGIEVLAGVTFAAGGALVNSGNITGTTTAIDASAATAPVTIDQSGGTITGTIKLSANADVLNITGGTINGNIVGQGSSDTINFAPSGFLGTFTYATPYGFTGINQVNINSGFVVLNGNDNATNIDVNGGVLFGTGTLDPLAVTIHSGGTLAPGGVGTPGTMTINGNLVFLSGATYLVQIGAGGASLVNVSGTATLAGTVSAVLLPGATIAHQYTILHSAGLGGTTFSSLDVFGGITASLVYLPNPSATDVDLDITANLGMAAPAGGFNINQQNVSTSLTNYFNSGGSLTPGISAVLGLSGPALANALTQLSGEAATGTQQVSTQMMNEFLDMMLDPFVAGRDTGGGGGAGTSNGFAPERQAGLPPNIALAYDSVMPAPRPADFDQRWSVWGSGFGGSSTTSGDAVVGSHDVTANTYGAAAGMDYHLSPDSVLGFALAGAGSNWSLTQSLGGGRDTAFQAGVYGKTNFGPAYFAAAFAFANHWFTTNRTAFAGDQLGASFQGQSYGGRFEAGYRFAVAAASGITPYAAVQAQAFHTPGYSETDLSGGGFALSYGAMNATDTRSELGARFNSLQILGNMPVVWHGRVAWAHDWVSNPALGATFESLPGASFTVNGAAPPPNSALASAGAKFYITPSWSFDTKFDGEFASGSQTYAGTGTLRYSW